MGINGFYKDEDYEQISDLSSKDVYCSTIENELIAVSWHREKKENYKKYYDTLGNSIIKFINNFYHSGDEDNKIYVGKDYFLYLEKYNNMVAAILKTRLKIPEGAVLPFDCYPKELNRGCVRINTEQELMEIDGNINDLINAIILVDKKYNRLDIETHDILFRLLSEMSDV